MPRLNVPVPVPEGHKWCRPCGEVKPHRLFTRDRRKPDGRCHQCAACCRRKARERESIARMVDEFARRLA